MAGTALNDAQRDLYLAALQEVNGSLEDAALKFYRDMLALVIADNGWSTKADAWEDYGVATPADGGTVTADFSSNKSWKITSPDTGAGMDFIIDITNLPTDDPFWAMAFWIVVGTNVPTISYKIGGTTKTPNGTVPTLTDSKNHIWIISGWTTAGNPTINESKVY